MDTKTKKIADSLIKDYKMTPYEAFKIACQMESNSLFKEAFGCGYLNDPPALEAIAIALGYDHDKPTSIKDALFQIAQSIEEK